ncbi:MAG: hypothetical protein JW881_05015 [Spirochaetales bacterium]|nr:hypothetical protein [Spirochaetales bacterium]
MKRNISLKYLKQYLSDFLWKLQETLNDDPAFQDYRSFIFRTELDNVLTYMEKKLSGESDLNEVREALRYILNADDFDYVSLLRETARLTFLRQDEARDLLSYIWRYIFEDSFEYPPGLSCNDFVLDEQLPEKKIDITTIITQKKWHHATEQISWDTQIFFDKDGTGTLCYIHLKNANHILFNFRYKIKKNEYTGNSLIMIHFPDLNVAFELAIKVIKAMKRIYRRPKNGSKNGTNGHNTVIKLSDNPFFLTQDFLQRRNHFPQETVFYQL